MMNTAEAARRIASGLERDRGVIVFPFLFAALTWLSGILPSVMRRLVSGPFKFTVKN